MEEGIEDDNPMHQIRHTDAIITNDAKIKHDNIMFDNV